MRAGVLGALVAVQLIFGTLPVAAKPALELIHPAWYTLLRAGFAAAILALLTHGVLRRPLPAAAALPALALYGALGVALNMLLFLEGLHRTTATNASIILTAIPALTYVVALAARRETFSRVRTLGILLALAGVLVLLDPRRAQSGLATLTGDLLIVANSLTYAIYLVLTRTAVRGQDPLVFTTWVFVPASLLLVPYALMQPWPTGAGAEAWASLAYVVAGPTLATYFLNIWALGHVRASTVAAFVYIQPLVTAVLATRLLGETITARHVVALVLVVAGVALVWGRERRARRMATGATPP